LLSQGAISGMLGGLLITLWISVGRGTYVQPSPTLPVGTCLDNVTISLPPTVPNA